MKLIRFDSIEIQKMKKTCVFFLLLSLCLTTSLGFQSDELLGDDDEFIRADGIRSTESDAPTRPVSSTRRSSASDSDSKLSFLVEHAFGDSDFSPAGTFSARLKTSSHGAQTLTKLRFSRNVLTETEREEFKRLLEGDGFYKIRLPSNVLSPPGREYVVSSVKARCLPRDTLDEHFVLNMEGVNLLGVNYGSPGACQYPRQLKFPSTWSFKSHTILKYSDVAPRTPIFTEEAVVGENGEVEEKPPERSFWAKYWMYLIPVGIMFMNALTQAMNAPEEQAAGQAGGGAQQPQQIRAPANAPRRR